MNKRIAIFNALFYGITLLFYALSRQDPSSSLGYAFFIIGFWGLATVLLIVLLIKKVIIVRTILDKIGLFTATPILLFLVISFFPSTEYYNTVRYFNKNNHRYKVLTYHFRKSSRIARIEYYRSADVLSSNEVNDVWLKDSTWIYYSEAGDTVKTIHYNEDIRLDE